MPSVTMDGRQVDFQPGETIIQVATKNATEIPHYCWHPRLSVAANCRMCLVDVEKQPKLVPACQTPCADGMVIHTRTPKVKDAQRAVHEFLLINHPIDCPICDQAGECKLQDYYMKFQLAPSRMRDVKVDKPRYEPLGPNVMYNAERCVVCTRCIRFMEEVAHDRQLGVFNRGDHSEIGTMPGQELDSPYSLNTVDVCPVGALTSRIFRFKQRVWNLRRSESLCGGCARGCNTWVDHRSSQVYRMLPRDNDAVNASWMCDEGRLTYNRPNDRLEAALARTPGGALGAIAAPEALRLAAQLLGPVAGSVAPVLSLHATCEEAYVFGLLARDVLRASKVTLIGYADGEGDDVLRVADKNPNRAGVTRVLNDLGLKVGDGDELEKALQAGAVKALLVVGHEHAALERLAQLASRLEVFVHVAHARTALAEQAHVTLPGASHVQIEGTWINFQGRLQRLKPAFPPGGEARPHVSWIVELAAALGSPLDLPTVATVRAELEKKLPSFRGARLGDVGPAGALAVAP